MRIATAEVGAPSFTEETCPVHLDRLLVYGEQTGNLLVTIALESAFPAPAAAAP
jgi:hypothetical protein